MSWYRRGKMQGHNGRAFQFAYAQFMALVPNSRAPNPTDALPISQTKGGFGGRSERRRLAAGQPAVSERSPPSKTKRLRVARLLARGANVQITACVFNSLARNSWDLYPIRMRTIQPGRLAFPHHHRGGGRDARRGDCRGGDGRSDRSGEAESQAE